MELRQVKVLLSKGSRVFRENESVSKPAQYGLGAFHCWEHFKDEDSSQIYGIVELPDGKVKRFELSEMTFTSMPSGANLFEQGLPKD